MMTSSDIAKEKVSLLPVRELVLISSVQEIWIAKGERIFLIKGDVFGSPLSARSMRTSNAWNASLCRAAIGHPPIFLTWQKNPFNRMAWNEHDLISVEPQ